jgi:uncharacterized protein (DUF1499 family)
VTGASAVSGSGSHVRRGLPVAAVFGTLVATLGIVVLAASGLVYRVGVWPLPVAFTVLGVGGWIGLVGGFLALIGAVLTRPGTGRRGFLLSLLGLLIGFGTFAWVISWRLQARSAPAIRDITTDFANPPAFGLAQPQPGVPAPPPYGGLNVAAEQRASYPDIGPADLPVPPGAAFRIALAAARNLGWDVVAADSTSGRIEAVATTRWFGFTDDIAVRVAATEHGSRVDVRSVSRVGPDDVPENANRVRTYIAQLQRTV